MPDILAVVPFYAPFPGGAEKSMHETLCRMTRTGFTVRALVLPSRWSVPTPVPRSLDGVIVHWFRTIDAFLAGVREHAPAADLIFYSRAPVFRGIFNVDADPLLLPYRSKTVYFCRDLNPEDFFPAALVVANSRATLAQLPESVASTVLLTPPLSPAQPPKRAVDRKFVTMINPMLKKGGDVFMEVARRMPGTPFMAQLGPGPPVPGLRELPNVDVRRSTSDLDSVYAETDVLLVPSRVEPFGRVALEGAQAGCGVLAHRVDGLREVPLPEVCYLDTLAVQDWVHRLSEMLSASPIEKDSLRLATRKAAEAYEPGWDAFLQATADLHSRVGRCGAMAVTG